jgi:hypothetical protein
MLSTTSREAHSCKLLSCSRHQYPDKGSNSRLWSGILGSASWHVLLHALLQQRVFCPDHLPLSEAPSGQLDLLSVREHLLRVLCTTVKTAEDIRTALCTTADSLSFMLGLVPRNMVHHDQQQDHSFCSRATGRLQLTHESGACAREASPTSPRMCRAPVCFRYLAVRFSN